MKRCTRCKVPLEGMVSKILKTVLRVQPSQKDPALCNHCAKDSSVSKAYVCQICNRRIEEQNALTHVKAEEYLLELIRRDHPEWKETQGACPHCLEYYRALIKKANI